MDQNYESPNIVFDEEGIRRPVQSFQKQTPKIIYWTIKYSNGLIKNENQAQYLLLGFVALSIIFTFSLYFSSGSGNKAKFVVPPGKVIIYPSDAPPRLEDKF